MRRPVCQYILIDIYQDWPTTAEFYKNDQTKARETLKLRRLKTSAKSLRLITTVPREEPLVITTVPREEPLVITTVPREEPLVITTRPHHSGRGLPWATLPTRPQRNSKMVKMGPWQQTLCRLIDDNPRVLIAWPIMVELVRVQEDAEHLFSVASFSF